MTTILKHTANRAVETFKAIYQTDRYLARIYAIENKPTENTLTYNYVSPGVFQIFDETKVYSVTTTLKMYAAKKSNKKLFVNNTKFYLHYNSRIMPITLRAIDAEFLQLFIEQFSWVRFLQEYRINDISFNTIVRNKLYSRDKLLKYMYGCDYERAIAIKRQFDYRRWKILRKNIKNIENFNIELLENDTIFADTVSLGFKLNKQINAAWSARRLKEEHDAWSKEYTNIAFEINNRNLNIHPIFKKFNDFIGGGLLTTSKELAIEGHNQNHCVASYSTVVDRGRVAIFHIQGFTAEIINTGFSLKLGQFKGHRNSDGPKEIKSRLIESLEIFNDNMSQKEFEEFPVVESKELELDELPF